MALDAEFDRSGIEGLAVVKPDPRAQRNDEPFVAVEPGSDQSSGDQPLPVDHFRSSSRVARRAADLARPRHPPVCHAASGCIRCVKLKITGVEPNGAGLIVTSQIIKANGEPIKIDYMTRQNGSDWLIADIYLNGTISEVATRRSEFGAISTARPTCSPGQAPGVLARSPGRCSCAGAARV